MKYYKYLFMTYLALSVLNLQSQNRFSIGYLINSPNIVIDKINYGVELNYRYDKSRNLDGFVSLNSIQYEKNSKTEVDKFKSSMNNLESVSRLYKLNNCAPIGLNFGISKNILITNKFQISLGISGCYTYLNRNEEITKINYSYRINNPVSNSTIFVQSIIRNQIETNKRFIGFGFKSDFKFSLSNKFNLGIYCNPTYGFVKTLIKNRFESIPADGSVIINRSPGYFNSKNTDRTFYNTFPFGIQLIYGI